ncbi:unnamed protein product [Heligmosomoides polygyrus]|uniref:Retrotransposon protein, putative, unclassified n=1 Tax=Heligmosomoides polygyrus TaxID=6339 RepID=A0A183G2N3_HELPZ|nr:unnamed protein product [Heligmosomoides polygyrus]
MSLGYRPLKRTDGNSSGSSTTTMTTRTRRVMRRGRRGEGGAPPAAAGCNGGQHQRDTLAINTRPRAGDKWRWEKRGKRRTDGRTDGPLDRPTDRPTMNRPTSGRTTTEPRRSGRRAIGSAGGTNTKDECVRRWRPANGS